ncbi:hypothetical protein ACFSQJ_18360 [Croceitalea marina]|uniref:DUF5625 domain-containing protein n=1 Tax=Croceitalea marina TaxID=1775166 RepID=A0ABW5N071_9FLAO
MRISILIIALISSFSVTAQSVSGKLTLNEKSKTELKLETNSAVQLFKEFKTGKYQLKFSFDGKELPNNIYKEKIIFFEFITSIKKDGKLVKNVIRKQPIPYFPGEMFLPAEAFDFIGVLAGADEEASATVVPALNELLGTMPKGNYTVELSVKPLGVKGEIKPVEFSFLLRKRPGRTKL